MDTVDSITEPPFSPVTAVGEWINAKGYTQKEAALMLQWKAPELSMVLNGKRPISERMARDLARTLGDVPRYKGWTSEDWMELQKDFSLRTNRVYGDSENWRGKSRIGILSDADICDAVQSGLLKIEPFDEEAVLPASYDLKPGTVSWFRRGHRKITFNGDEEEIVAPGETVLIVVRERIRIPANMAGRVAPVGSLVEMGVHCTFGIQLDPGWSGFPFFTLTHNGDEDLTLGGGYGCASVEFHFLERKSTRPFGVSRRDKAI